MDRLTIAFVGQCHTVGYAGVPPDVAFPQVCRRVVQAARPESEVDVVLEPYYHPSELERAVRHALTAAPRVVVIEAIAWLAVTGSRAVDLSRLPQRFRSTYERVRHFRHVSTKLAEAIPAGPELVWRAQKSMAMLAGSVLRPLIPRYPRPTVEEYEACISEALALVDAVPGVDVVVQGPGAPNLTLDARGIASDAVERYHAVNEMARRVAEARGALYVDRWDTVSAGFFSDGSIRPSADGHSVWGHLLADALIAHGVV